VHVAAGVAVVHRPYRLAGTAAAAIASASVPSYLASSERLGAVAKVPPRMPAVTRPSFPQPPRQLQSMQESFQDQTLASALVRSDTKPALNRHFEPERYHKPFDAAAAAAVAAAAELALEAEEPRTQIVAAYHHR
jgi:hypothetical protein